MERNIFQFILLLQKTLDICNKLSLLKIKNLILLESKIYITFLKKPYQKNMLKPLNQSIRLLLNLIQSSKSEAIIMYLYSINQSGQLGLKDKFILQ